MLLQYASLPLDVYKRQKYSSLARMRAFSLCSRSMWDSSNSGVAPVSYTHLDVYKRQVSGGALQFRRGCCVGGEADGLYQRRGARGQYCAGGPADVYKRQGLDHVLASGEDVNVMVFDTEVYSCLLYTSRCV